VVVLEAVRVIDDTWSWSSLSRLAPTAYHDQAWTAQSVRRIQRRTRIPVAGMYVRVWSDDTLIGCPVIRVGPATAPLRMFNTPRAAPAILNGEPCDHPAATLIAGLAEFGSTLVVHDDKVTLVAIAKELAFIERQADDFRQTRSWRPGDTRRVFHGYRWPDPKTRIDWDDSISALFRSSSWSTVMKIHTVAGDLVGWTVWADRPNGSTCLAAIHRDRRLHPWTSPR
jgi:hypothetical protein